MKYLCCKDVVQFDCDWECRGGSVGEIIEKVSIHARELHGLTEIPSTVLDKVKTAIKDM